jgi:TonB-dependent receptor
MFERDAKLKFGVSYLFKERDYEILFFDLQRFGAAPELNGDPNNVLIQQNIFPTGVYYYQTGNSDPNPNEYNSTVDNTAAYISSEFELTPKLKTVAGLRVENYVQRHTGRDQNFAISGQGNNLVDEKVLDSFDFFPSLNMIYGLNENQNLRVSYSRTIARPSFKELSFAQILDPITNRTFNGGLFPFVEGDGTVIWDGNLTETRINNVDLRWELFLPAGQLFSISAFYKSFDRPIELVRIPVAQTGLEFQPRNVGDGEIFGAELEFRKSLDFLSPGLANFSINGNVTIVESTVEMSITEFEARQEFEKNGETLDGTREMAGQAPYIINAGISYNNQETGLEAGLFYNVKGATLTIVGGGLTPDIFSEPFNSLNFNLNKSLGEDQRTTINLGVNNILNDVREEFYTGFNAEDQYFSRLSPGTSFSFGVKYNIF